jgi:hypothetical protein
MLADPGRRHQNSWRATLDRQTIYRWWPSKGAEVFEAFLARALEEQWFEPRRAPAREALCAARDAGQARSDVDPDMALDGVFAPLHYRLLVSQDPIGNRFAGTVVDLCLTALRP